MSMNMKLKSSGEITSSAIWDSFKRLCSEMNNQGLAEFLLFWINPDTEVGQRYFTSPGSRPGTGHGHHDYVGGLAIHSVRAAWLSKKICEHYRNFGREVNTDLVVAGVLIHDIGKAWSYEPTNEEQTEWEHSHQSKHLHHIPIGHREFCKAVAEWKASGRLVSEEIYLQLQHIILSHHGKVAWSSPVTPRTTEAYIVHTIEMLDGFLEGKYFKGEPPRRLYD